MIYYRRKRMVLIPNPAIIIDLCLLGGVDEEWGNKETFPKVSPLTLTGVMKGPKNRGKEIEEAWRNEICNEPVQWESPPQE